MRDRLAARFRARRGRVATITLVSGLSLRISSSAAKPSAVPSGSGGRPRSSVTTAGSCGAQRLDRARAVAGADDLITFIGPFRAGAAGPRRPRRSAGRGVRCRRSCAFPFGFARPASAAGRVMVKLVPSPGRLSTSSRPPIAVISERASNAPMPKPPGLVEAKGWNRRLRTKSASMPTPLSAMLIATVVALAR